MFAVVSWVSWVGCVAGTTPGKPRSTPSSTPTSTSTSTTTTPAPPCLDPGADSGTVVMREPCSIEGDAGWMLVRAVGTDWDEPGYPVVARSDDGRVVEPLALDEGKLYPENQEPTWTILRLAPGETWNLEPEHLLEATLAFQPGDAAPVDLGASSDGARLFAGVGPAELDVPELSAVWVHQPMGVLPIPTTDAAGVGVEWVGSAGRGRATHAEAGPFRVDAPAGHPWVVQSLPLSEILPDAEPEVEPNDSPGSANARSGCSFELEGELAPGDEDWFEFTPDLCYQDYSSAIYPVSVWFRCTNPVYGMPSVELESVDGNGVVSAARRIEAGSGVFRVASTDGTAGRWACAVALNQLPGSSE